MKKRILLAALAIASLSAMAQRSNPEVDSLRNEKNPTILKEKIKKLGQGDENDIGILLQYYGNDQAKGDSVLQATLVRFPKGKYAAIQAQNKIFREKSAIQQENLFKRFKATYPSHDFDMINYSLAYAYANEKNSNKALSFATEIKSPSFKQQTIAMLAEMVMVYDLKTSEMMVSKELNEAKKANAAKTENPAPNTPGAPQGNAKAVYTELLSTYSRILNKQGKKAEALRFASEAYQNAPRKNDALTGNYAYLLSVNGKYQEAFPLLEKIVAEGKGNSEQKQALQTAYENLNPGKNGAAYLATLANGLHQKVQEEIAKLMVNEKAPNFEVKDAQGKTVSLADYKGKIIILDFWATWCGPCKKSFPAMQMAVNKFKNDPNVKFLFIHTWEQVADPLADAQKYLNDNHYNFDLFMDAKNPITKVNEAVKLFGVKGIPAKFVIDGNGLTRFKLSGFSGADDVAVAEIAAMIAQIRKG